MIRPLTALVALLLLASPCAALAQGQQTNAPAGNSAIDEYIETVPGANGAVVPGSRATKGGGAPALKPSARARLERLGDDGKALAAAVDATSPATSDRTRARTPVPAAAEARTPLRAVLDGAAGDGAGGGMGALLPAILLASLLGAIALVVARRHAAS